jgi:hypothetical protein
LIDATFGALPESRLIGGFENPTKMIHSKDVLLYFYENKTIVGELPGGLPGVEIVKTIIREKKKSGDPFTYAIGLTYYSIKLGYVGLGYYLLFILNPHELTGLPT